MQVLESEACASDLIGNVLMTASERLFEVGMPRIPLRSKVISKLLTFTELQRNFASRWASVS